MNSSIITFYILLAFLACIAYGMYIVKQKAGDDMATYSVNTRVSEQFLLYSNVGYILPMIILTFGWIQKKSNKIHTIMWLEIMVILSLVVVISSNYHQCRSELTEANTNDPTELNIETIPLAQCPNVTGRQMSSDYAERIDMFMATYAIGIILIYLLPLTWEQVAMARVVLMALILGGVTFPSKNITMLINGVAMTVLAVTMLYFVVYKKWDVLNDMTKWLFSIGIVFSLVGVAMFQLYPSPYWLMHSMWHLCGGIACAFMLLGYMNIK